MQKCSRHLLPGLPSFIQSDGRMIPVLQHHGLKFAKLYGSVAEAVRYKNGVFSYLKSITMKSDIFQEFRDEHKVISCKTFKHNVRGYQKINALLTFSMGLTFG